MAIVFWDRKEQLMVEFMQQRTSIMAEVYCKTVEHFNWEFFHDNPPYSPDLTMSSHHLFTYLN
jgi:hypothetical protein